LLEKREHGRWAGHSDFNGWYPDYAAGLAGRINGLVRVEGVRFQTHAVAGYLDLSM
jgi:hypothetical protein